MNVAKKHVPKGIEGKSGKAEELLCCYRVDLERGGNGHFVWPTDKKKIKKKKHHVKSITSFSARSWSVAGLLRASAQWPLDNDSLVRNKKVLSTNKSDESISLFQTQYSKRFNYADVL